MNETDWRDMVWLSNPTRAGTKAASLSHKTAESMLIVQDTKTGLFGVGMGSEEPSWCQESKGFRLVAVVHPEKN